MAKDKMTPTRRNIILALADSAMNPTAAARKLFYNHTTVRYHIGIIKRITGLDPMNFYDLCELVACVKGAENG